MTSLRPVTALAWILFLSSTVLASTGKGLAPGDPIGAFYVTKVAGAEGDGVEVGEELCYRCRYGSRPMAMVFVRSIDGKVGELVKHLDALVAKHEAEHFRTLVIFLGDDSAELKSLAEKLAAGTAAKHAAIAVAKDSKTGPINYRVPAETDVTIVLAKDSQVMDFATFEVDKIDVAKIAAKVAELVKEDEL